MAMSHSPWTRERQAWWTAAFTGLTQSKGGLKPLRHYLGSKPRRRAPAELHEVFRRAKAAGLPITITRRKRTDG